MTLGSLARARPVPAPGMRGALTLVVITTIAVGVTALVIRSRLPLEAVGGWALVAGAWTLAVAMLAAGATAPAKVAQTDKLERELRSAVRELRETRQRLFAASDDERRRIEADLHDGAQQRLVAL